MTTRQCGDGLRWAGVILVVMLAQLATAAEEKPAGDAPQPEVPAVESDGQAVDADTKARAEAALAAYLREQQGEPAERSRVEANPEAVPPEDRAAIMKAEAAVLEAETYLKADNLVAAGEAFLSAGSHLSSVSDEGRAALGDRYRAARQDMSDLARALSDGGLGVQPAVPKEKPQDESL